MKSFIALAFVALIASACALTDEQKSKAEEFAKACIQDVGVTPEEVAKLKMGDFQNPSQNVKCFANCILEKANFMKDGVFQDSVALEKLSQNTDKAKVQQIVDGCKSTKGAEKCDTAFNLMECYAKSKAQLA